MWNAIRDISKLDVYFVGFINTNTAAVHRMALFFPTMQNVLVQFQTTGVSSAISLSFQFAIQLPLWFRSKWQQTQRMQQLNWGSECHVWKRQTANLCWKPFFHATYRPATLNENIRGKYTATMYIL